MNAYRRGDIVLDDSGNHFVHCPHLGAKRDAGDWFGLPSNQASARGFYRSTEDGHPYAPLHLVVSLRADGATP